MEEQRLLMALVLAVANMRRRQTELNKLRPGPTTQAVRDAEREVDSLVALHLTPSAFQEGSRADQP